MHAYIYIYIYIYTHSRMYIFIRNANKKSLHKNGLEVSCNVLNHQIKLV